MQSKTLAIKGAHLVLMANVKDAPFKCLSCKKVFISEIHLKRHEERRHNLTDLSLPARQTKEHLTTETLDAPTIKAVLSATGRIEDLLVKLALRETEKPNEPLACSSPKNICEDKSLVAFSSSSSEKSLTSSDKSIQTLDDIPLVENLKELPKMKYYDFLEAKENEVLWKVTAPVVETYVKSNQVLNPIVHIINEHQNIEKFDVCSSLSHYDDTFQNETSSINDFSRIKAEIVKKLNNKLDSYGINYYQDTLSDNEVSRIGQLLKEEREQIAEKTPEYYKLRELINDNAERRIEESLQSKTAHH